MHKLKLWLKNLIRQFSNGPYCQCKVCKNYKDVRDEFAYLDNVGYFCLNCAQTHDLFYLKTQIKLELAIISKYYWRPDNRMMKKYKCIINDLRIIRRKYRL